MNTTRNTASSRGFSMVEMLIVVSVIAILATIAVPNYLSSRVVANEASVIATLKKIATSELLFRQSRYTDLNRNSAGEFGYLGELSGLTPIRGSGEFLNPPVLNPSFGYVDGGGYSERHGYYFRLYLPDGAGVGVPEIASQLGTIDAAAAENFFTCVAWPKAYGKTGQRTFFMNQQGDIHATVDSGYSGKAGTPIANAGLAGVAPKVITTNSLATGGQVGVDGNRWQPVH